MEAIFWTAQWLSKAIKSLLFSKRYIQKLALFWKWTLRLSSEQVWKPITLQMSFMCLLPMQLYIASNNIRIKGQVS